MREVVINFFALLGLIVFSFWAYATLLNIRWGIVWRPKDEHEHPEGYDPEDHP